jgi:hypothetical protein
MGRSKLPVILSLCSIAIAAGAVVALFTINRPAHKDESQVRATSYSDEPSGGQTPIPIDPATVNFRQTGDFAVDMKKVAAIVVDSDDHIYVAGDRCLCRYSPNGQLENRTTLLFDPTCLAVGGRQHLYPGRVYVGFIDHVEVFSPDGSKEAIWQRVDKARFSSISASDHDIFVADEGWNVIQHFDTAGKLLSPMGENSPGHFAPGPGDHKGHFDLIVGLNELIYAINRRDSRIEGWSSGGGLERHWGQASPLVEDFAGRNNPAQIALTGDGRFVTAEEDPLRIKTYDRTGHLSGLVCGSEGVGAVTDLAADSHNRILVLDGPNHRVRIFEEKTSKPKKE